ncbi:MAG: hypothetical protein ABJH01_00960 [Algoriphagus sp.]
MEFLKQLNMAFAKGDLEFVTESVTDDIVWDIIGDRKIEGKEKFVEELEKMKSQKATEMIIHQILSHGKEGAANGIMKMKDEKYRQELNTQKDLMDILINLGNHEVIIVECKTSKESGYNKFSTVSRQLKSYQNIALKNNLRIVKILLVAPEFSDDFVTDCEMDVDMNLSLLTASTLIAIYEAFKNSKYMTFPHVLFRDVVINQERIVKALSK